MPHSRWLIVNADDFGLSPGVNRGIIRAHEHGIVTSASLMVRWPAASEAAEYARGHEELSVGLHVDLCEWSFVDGSWRVVYEVAPVTDAAAVAKEVERQLHAFRRLMGRDPTHLDSHQHVHREEPVRSVLLHEASIMGVPVRSVDRQIRYCGDFYGQADKGYAYPQGITVDALVSVITNLPAGITELGCHPGEVDDLDSMYKHERLVECQSLCDPRALAAIAAGQIVLCSFSDRPKHCAE
jgi:chitin disaccharide deacetylase